MRQFISTAHKIFLVACGAALAACGGGGGGGGDSGGGQSEPVAFQCTIESTDSFSISGEVSVAQGSIVDSDTLGSGIARQDNGSFASAQPIPRPISLGGFASKNDQGLGGYVDTNDFYTEDLVAGDVITMLVADAIPGINDLDLYLYDVNRRQVGASIRSGTLEALEVPADGLYYLEVRVFEGGSGYVLSVGGGVGAQVTPSNFMDQEFVPGEIIVKYKQQDTDDGLQARASSVSEVPMDYIAGERDRAMLMRMPEYFAASASAASVQSSSFANEVEQRKYDTLMAVKRLQQDERVEFASPNYLRRPLDTVPNDPRYASQWHYNLINLPQAWDTTTGSPNVVVAVIDTGLRTDHPEFEGKLVDGYDFVSSPSRAGDGDGIDSNPFDPYFGVFHGTHVTGTVAAGTNNGKGIAGVGWGVRVMPLRALGEDEGTFYDIIQAMLYAAGLPNDSGSVPSKRADIINLSLGGPLVVPDGFEQSIVDRIRAAGTIVIAAAGNQGNSVSFYPASYVGVVSVSAVGRPALTGADPKLASYSSFGPGIDVAGPGGDRLDVVLSTSGPDCSVADTCPVENYVGLKGTSMAAPHVAGVAALMQSARVASGQPPLTPLEFDSLLQDGRLTKDLGSKGRDDQFGYGLIKADKAVQAALTINVEPPPPSLAVTPDILNFRTDFTAASVIMSNAGGGELQVETVTELPADAGWLRIDAPESDDGLGTYIFRVSRSDLADGDYSATVRLQSSANTVDIEVAMTVSSARKRTDVGDIYVRLYEAEEILFTGNQIGVTSRDGSFRFDDVPGGCYIVAAGTNLDGDSFIGDIGEAWSGYPSKVEFDPILLDANANAIDFEIAFDQAELIPSSSEPK